MISFPTQKSKALFIVGMWLSLLARLSIAQTTTDEYYLFPLIAEEKLEVKPTDTYSLFLFDSIPAHLQRSNLFLHFSAFTDTPSPIHNAALIIELYQNDSMVYWHSCPLSCDTVFISDTVRIPASHSAHASVKAYIWNKTAEDFVLYSPSVRLSTFQLPSWMPITETPDPPEQAEILWQNRFYELVYKPNSGSLYINDSKGETMIGPIVWHVESDVDGRQVIVETHQWKKSKSRNHSHGAELLLTSQQCGQQLKLQIKTYDHSGNIEINARLKYKRKHTIIRNSLLLHFHDQVNEVFRSNSLSDTSNFQPEYYLGSSGFRIGKDRRSFLMYHNPELSSIQLHTTKQFVTLNFDYKEDHLLIHYPLIEDSTNYFIDRSAAVYPAGTRTQYAFSLHIGAPETPLARLMPLPDGFEAAVIFTEHADWTNLRTQRAVFFGHEDIIHAEDATGGFVKWQIPVTKSVFYHNPDRITNSLISQGRFTEPHATVTTDTAFFHFLKQLHTLGHEICLHTPEQHTSTVQYMKDALAFMQHHFASSGWIDHGYNNGLQNNRENLICDGLLPRSPWYSADLWRKYGLRHFWNCSVEEAQPFMTWGFDGQLMVPFPGFGDAFPNPMITTHPEHPDLWLWSTTGTLEISDDKMWDYFFHPNRLNQLIKNRKVWINHVYPAWANETKGFWTTDTSGKIIAMTGMNNALQSLAAYRDAGKILPITIDKYIRYFSALMNLTYTPMENGTILITNKGTDDIHGLSFVISSEKVLVNGKEPLSKKLGDETVFWFDLPAFSKAVIYVN